MCVVLLSQRHDLWIILATANNRLSRAKDQVQWIDSFYNQLYSQRNYCIYSLFVLCQANNKEPSLETHTRYGMLHNKILWLVGDGDVRRRTDCMIFKRFREPTCDVRDHCALYCTTCTTYRQAASAGLRQFLSCTIHPS